jgi:hypothetical protein
LDNNRPVIRSGFFSDIAPASDVLSNEIYTYYSDYSYSHWSYDPGTQQYLRFQETDDIHDGKPEKYGPLVDRITSEQVHASNVVFLLASYTFANTSDQEDEVHKVDLSGSGEAYVFRDGVGIVARWYCTNTNQPLLLTASNGTILNLRPGITFYPQCGICDMAPWRHGPSDKISIEDL